MKETLLFVGILCCGIYLWLDSTGMELPKNPPPASRPTRPHDPSKKWTLGQVPPASVPVINFIDVKQKMSFPRELLEARGGAPFVYGGPPHEFEICYSSTREGPTQMKICAPEDATGLCLKAGKEVGEWDWSDACPRLDATQQHVYFLMGNGRDARVVLRDSSFQAHSSQRNHASSP